MSTESRKPETDFSAQPKNQSGFGEAKTSHGIWRIIPSPMVTEVFAQAGFGFQILDCEHGAYDFATLLPDILACERHGCAPCIRVSGTNKIEVQRCLDLGARGLVFPQLATLEDFERAGAMMDYAPAGTRGYNPFVRAMGFGSATTTAAGAARPWFIPIVETLQAVEAIDAIVRLPRVDLVYIGAYDLSAQLGCAGRMDAPELTAVMDRIIEAARRAGKPIGSMALTADAARALARRGIQAIVHGVDSHRIKQSMAAILAPLQDSPSDPATTTKSE
ncbi:MAG: aldolase/citrate lyase family protein [Opitutaceae bacterium]|nr:aldolase/citrate lyase family protein [Opitutaceae bacterium]